jgi:hypothetical protein
MSGSAYPHYSRSALKVKDALRRPLLTAVHNDKMSLSAYIYGFTLCSVEWSLVNLVQLRPTKRCSLPVTGSPLTTMLRLLHSIVLVILVVLLTLAKRCVVMDRAGMS